MMNWIIDASSAIGIDIRNTAAHFVVLNCSIHGGETAGYAGISLTGCTNGEIISNNCTDNGRGISLISNADGNRLSGNILRSNAAYGISVEGSSKNRIWNNTFYQNNGAGSDYNYSRNQAFDDGLGASGSNYWNNSEGYGNSWSDWTSPDVSAPYRTVDLPYNISGSAGVRDCYPQASPTCTITSPTGSSTYLTKWGWIKLTGVAHDDVAVVSVTWSNSLGGSGNAYMTPQYGGANVNWQSRGNVQLFAGINVITVYARDANGSLAVDTLTAVYDTAQPTCTITSPTSSPTYATNSSNIALSGVASDDGGIVAVAWKNMLTGASGTASGKTNWTIANISLNEGSNLIYVNATDIAGNNKGDTITVSSYPVEYAHPGSRVTFAGVPTGTTSSITYLNITGNSATDAVVLDGELWIMYRSSNQAEIARYHPSYSESSWNISFEAYAPKTGSSYVPSMDPGKFGLQATIWSGSSKVAGVELAVGNASSEGIYALEGSTWQIASHGIAPAFPGGNSSFGEKPDRYVVSFEWKEGIITAMVRHTALGLLLVRAFTASGADAAIHLASDSAVHTTGTGADVRSVNGGWMVDDLTIRAPGSAYPILPLLWADAPQSGPVRVKLTDEHGVPLAVQMRIAGNSAVRNGAYYEAYYPRNVDWCAATTINIDYGPVIFQDSIKITTTSTASGARVTKWWGGWDWASVLGTDDCGGFSTAKNIYNGYDHPITAYVEYLYGASSDILASQSELAIHLPHDYIYWKSKTWGEALSSATSSHSQMANKYTFASRWDNPSYVGNGDTYISLANPGSAGTYEVMFAQYLMGTRIMGISSNNVDTTPGNSSLYGSWWSPTAIWWTNGGHSWQPSRPEDMMDAMRPWNTDGNAAPWALVQNVASQGGLLRVYNHRAIQWKAATVVHWIVDPKTNFSCENWKATDGEAASYIYASHTTSVSKNSSAGPIAYDVHRLNPKTAGYWLVPVTVSIDLCGRPASRVLVIEHTPSGDVSKALRLLNGKRVMDVGYDVRNDTLYVSDFFNSSATIIVSSLGVTITGPTSNPTMSTNWHMVCLRGTASDNNKVASVTWSNSLGGSGTAYMNPQWGGASVTWQSRGNVLLYSGVNIITATAHDASGNTASDTLTVIYDVTPPSCEITSPMVNPYSTSTASVSIAGTASDNVGVTSVSWLNAANGQSGTATGTTSWIVSSIPLAYGSNLITVTSHDSAGFTSSDTITVIFDSTIPTCIVTVPGDNPSYTSTGSADIGGFASDDSAVAAVTWVNDRGGSGTCSGTDYWWQGGLTLFEGWNNITVTVWDDGTPQKSTSNLIIIIFDDIDPTCTITVPTDSPTYNATGGTVDLGGTAHDNINIESISWSNDRGGSGSRSGGAAWTISGISLYPGYNNITVVAADETGNTGSDTITVIRDDVKPTCTIVTPAANPIYLLSGSVDVAGTAYDNNAVINVTWNNSATGQSGVCTGTTSWSQTGIALNPGNNLITITAFDAEGNSATVSLLVVNGTNPVVTITGPTANSTMTTSWHYVILTGSAIDDYNITNVYWSNSLTGENGIMYMTPQFGGANVTWQTRGSIHLLPGNNVITVTANDKTGHTGTDVLTVTYTGL
jgi:parallel beta-helix repeat protein